jgi:hypothetical protein
VIVYALEIGQIGKKYRSQRGKKKQKLADR